MPQDPPLSRLHASTPSPVNASCIKALSCQCFMRQSPLLPMLHASRPSPVNASCLKALSCQCFMPQRPLLSIKALTLYVYSVMRIWHRTSEMSSSNWFSKRSGDTRALHAHANVARNAIYDTDISMIGESREIIVSLARDRRYYRLTADGMKPDKGEPEASRRIQTVTPFPSRKTTTKAVDQPVREHTNPDNVNPLDQLDCWHCVKLMLKVTVTFLKVWLRLMFLIATTVLNLKLLGLKRLAATLIWLFAKFKVSTPSAPSSTYQGEICLMYIWNVHTLGGCTAAIWTISSVLNNIQPRWTYQWWDSCQTFVSLDILCTVHGGLSLRAHRLLNERLWMSMLFRTQSEQQKCIFFWSDAKTSHCDYSSMFWLLPQDRWLRVLKNLWLLFAKHF